MKQYMKGGFTYILTNKNHSVLYVGATKKLKERIDAHKSGTGALFAKKYRATILIYYEEFDDFSEAFKREKQLKNWHRQWKINLLEEHNPGWENLWKGDAETSSA